MNHNKFRAYLLLGGNIGDVARTFESARGLLPTSVNVVQQSALYRSPAWGMTAAPDFLNKAWQVETRLSPQELLNAVLDVERALGRERAEVNDSGEYHDRLIDIDILAYEDRVLDEPELKIPHPRMPERRFALIPLAEIAPEWVHPLSGASVYQLLAQTPDQGELIKL